MLDLEPIKARLNVETKLSWDVHLYVNGSTYVKTSDGDLVCNVYGNRKDTADLIARAPTDLAALVAEVEQLRSENKALAEEVKIVRQQRINDIECLDEVVEFWRKRAEEGSAPPEVKRALKEFRNVEY
jgi:hypothetical protein